MFMARCHWERKAALVDCVGDVDFETGSEFRWIKVAGAQGGYRADDTARTM
jgi:hypothetical protein